MGRIGVNEWSASKLILAFMSAVVMALFSWIAISVNAQQITLAELRIELRTISQNQGEFKQVEQQHRAVHQLILNRVTIGFSPSSTQSLLLETIIFQ